MKVKRDPAISNEVCQETTVRNAKKLHTQQSFIVAWGDEGDGNEGVDEGQIGDELNFIQLSFL